MVRLLIHASGRDNQICQLPKSQLEILSPLHQQALFPSLTIRTYHRLEFRQPPEHHRYTPIGPRRHARSIVEARTESSTVGQGEDGVRVGHSAGAEADGGQLGGMTSGRKGEVGIQVGVAGAKVWKEDSRNRALLE